MTMSNENTVIHMPAKLKASEAAGLKSMLAERRGRPVILDFAQVAQIGAQCLQVIIAANRTWQSERTAFEITNMSGDIREGLQMCGLPPSLLGAKETQDDA